MSTPQVQDVVDALYRHYPQELAEDWDRPGLSVGDPTARVTAIACALDATPTTVAQARFLGANVLVTHHPAFLTPPFPVTPSTKTSSMAGQLVWDAVTSGVSLIAMHTNLDRSQDALLLHASLLGLPFRGRLEEPDGYGALLDAGGLTLSELALRCSRAYAPARPPRVWGNAQGSLSRVAFCSGSANGFARSCVESDCDAIVCGEMSYHSCIDAVSGGCAVILLGHDVSELPYAGLLANTLAHELPETSINVLDEKPMWFTTNHGEEAR